MSGSECVSVVVGVRVSGSECVSVSACLSGPRLSLHPVCCAPDPLFPFCSDGHAR